jgi:nucleoside-diphosphate-sugar epimerase
MVIGNGMIARKFETYNSDDRFIIFASGVSNSKNSDNRAYAREIALLKITMQAHKEKILVYFSTCSFYDPEEMNSRYVQHKKEIEDLIQTSHPHYYIFRASNVSGRSGNPNTILNFFVYHIIHAINFDLWVNTTRNLIDIDDMFRVVNHLLQKKILANSIINIANPFNYTVLDIVKTIETFLGIQASFIPIQKGGNFSIDTSTIAPILKELDINFGDNYLINLLRKYYTA